MAVYTTVNDSELVTLLSAYDIGAQGALKAIEQGVENSNYFLTTETGKYILTIYEKRVRQEDLPYYLNLMEHLAGKGIPCPVPVHTREGKTLSRIKGQPCAIVTFLSGHATPVIRNEHMAELGAYMAKMHIAASDCDMPLENRFSLASWGELFRAVKHRADELKSGLAAEIEDQLGQITVQWPSSLYRGVVHADLFPDNVFFNTESKLVGMIDFYFACQDFLMYDVAVCLNAWCFEKNRDFNITKARKFLDAYNRVRKISEEELEALPVLARGAALRFLLTRLYDRFNPVEGALVKPKDPLEYLMKLRFHTGIRSHMEYGL